VNAEEIIRSTCGICFTNCGVLLHILNGRVTRIEGDPNSPVNKGRLCAKGLASLEYLYHPERLRHPLKRVGEKGEGKWQRVSWNEALSAIASELMQAKDNYGAESVAFIDGSAKGLQDAVLRRFANAFGSPNIISTDHICFVPRKSASVMTYGFYPIPDYEYPPSCILVWAANLADTRIGEHDQLCKAIDKGARLIVVDPRRTELARKADLWLQLRPGSDLALALGMINIIINDGLFDKDFVENWTVGFDKLKAHIQEYPPEKIAELTWVPAEAIRMAAKTYATNKPACIQLGNPIDHNVNSFQTARAISILRAITGNLGCAGGELEESSLASLDYFSPEIIFQDKVTAERWQKRIGAEGEFVSPGTYTLPQSLVKSIIEEKPYPIHAAYIQACNPLVTYSNARQAYKAFKKLKFSAVADMFMTPTAALADIVLPVASYLEYNSIVCAPYYPVAQVQQQVAQVGECRSDFEILNQLAWSVGLGEYFWDDEHQFLNEILRPVGLSFDEFRKVGVISGAKQYRVYEKNGFHTPSGKVELYSRQLEERGFKPLPTYHELPETPYSDPELGKEYLFILTSWKSAPYRHSGGRQIASLRGSHPEPITYIHPQTAQGLGVKDGDWVYIETRRGSIKQKAALSTDIDPRVVGVDYAWWFPERGASNMYGWAESNINILTDDKPPFNRETGSSNLRGILCKVHKA
jgi:anaerobic selenocysteine-containing dehydrogenase